MSSANSSSSENEDTTHHDSHITSDDPIIRNHSEPTSIKSSKTRSRKSSFSSSLSDTSDADDETQLEEPSTPKDTNDTQYEEPSTQKDANNDTQLEEPSTPKDVNDDLLEPSTQEDTNDTQLEEPSTPKDANDDTQLEVSTPKDSNDDLMEPSTPKDRNNTQLEELTTPPKVDDEGGPMDIVESNEKSSPLVQDEEMSGPVGEVESHVENSNEPPSESVEVDEGDLAKGVELKLSLDTSEDVQMGDTDVSLEEPNSAIGTKANVTMLDWNMPEASLGALNLPGSSVPLEAAFEPRRSSRITLSSNKPKFKFPSPRKLFTVKKKPTLKKDAIHVEASFLFILSKKRGLNGI